MRTPRQNTASPMVAEYTMLSGDVLGPKLVPTIVTTALVTPDDGRSLIVGRVMMVGAAYLIAALSRLLDWTPIMTDSDRPEPAPAGTLAMMVVVLHDTSDMGDSDSVTITSAQDGEKSVPANRGVVRLK
jgi:hypothetical protein